MTPVFVNANNNRNRIGTVAKFVGNEPSERWVAWALRTDPNNELRAAFRTRKEAIGWVRRIALERLMAKGDAL